MVETKQTDPFFSCLILFFLSNECMSFSMIILADYFIFILYVCIFFFIFTVSSLVVVACLVFYILKCVAKHKNIRLPSFYIFIFVDVVHRTEMFQPWSVHDALCCLHSIFNIYHCNSMHSTNREYEKKTTHISTVCTSHLAQLTKYTTCKRQYKNLYTPHRWATQNETNQPNIPLYICIYL